MSMTESEAIKRCNMLVNGFNVNNSIETAFTDVEIGYATFAKMVEFAETCKMALEIVQELHAIGTVEELRELKEKATAKKPIVEVYAQSLYERKTYRCPSCNHKLISKIDGGWCGGTLSNNCEKCGTALDWSEGKE